jgi:hypothetical protein
VHSVRAELEQRCAALEPGGEARARWRSAGTLCAPEFEASQPAAPAEAAALLGRSDADAAQLRRAQLQAELAWAEAALASRRAQLREARELREG